MTLFRNEVVDNFVAMPKQSQEQTLDIRRMLPIGTVFGYENMNSGG